jgi:hypothetical protein
MREMAIPGEYFLEPDARVKVMGMIAAVPNPVRQKPSSEGQNVGKRMARKMPKKMKQELTMNVFAIPIFSTRRSEANLESAIHIIYMR